MSKKYLYYFSEGNNAFGGDKVTMKNTLGGKGAGLAEMTAAGMPVPQGFTITTEACTQYYEDGRQINDEIMAEIMEYIEKMEKITGKKFGDHENPLLVSVRSGARASMPGMMDTILNLGLNDEAVEGLAKKTNNPRFAYDCYRRFVQMFADVVMMVPKSLFEVEIDKMKEAKGVKNDVDLTADDLKELVGTFKKIYEDNASGKLSDERYATLSLSYEEEQKTLKAAVLEMQAYLETETDKTESLQRFIQKVKQITELKALTPELIHEFVDKIVVYAPRYLDGKRVQLLDIYYSGVGILHELTPEEMEEAFQHHLAQRNKEKTA